MCLPATMMQGIPQTEGTRPVKINFSMVHRQIDSLANALPTQPTDLGENYHRLTKKEDLSELDWKAKATIV